MEPARVLLDTDVIINWLIQETETTSNEELWKAPHRIIKLIEEKDISGFISLTTLLEIRFLLRRKKKYSFQQIEDDIRKLTTVLDVIIPDGIHLIKANTLQIDLPLDPFDAIHLAVSITSSPIILLSRDKDFLRISKQFVKAITPEEFLKENFL